MEQQVKGMTTSFDYDAQTDVAAVSSVAIHLLVCSDGGATCPKVRK